MGSIALSRPIMKERLKMARAHCADEGMTDYEVCPFRPTV